MCARTLRRHTLQRGGVNSRDLATSFDHTANAAAPILLQPPLSGRQQVLPHFLRGVSPVAPDALLGPSAVPEERRRWRRMQACPPPPSLSFFLVLIKSTATSARSSLYQFLVQTVAPRGGEVRKRQKGGGVGDVVMGGVEGGVLL